ncbi:signal recognition particle-docking protein FtsY [Actinopolyspora mortivallis]|uniref:signal recognition particle-docking protein FtsY n=1 Tax=Actinopolyspora mortivallis TaxID=33906 RepID=UPI0003666EB9|nr:signal recognition particle-docking protein FtsY [Actinopolyspora mortivallis]
MTTTNVILIVIAALVVLALLVGTGFLLARRRRVSLSRDEQRDTSAGQGGGYRTGGGVSLSSGADTAVTEHPVGERTETEGQPAVGDDAAVPRDSERRDIVDVPLPTTSEDEAATAERDDSSVEDAGTAPEAREETRQEPAVPEQQTAAEDSTGPAPEIPRESTETGATTSAPERSETGAAPERTVPEEEPESERAGTEPIEPSAGRLERLRGRLSRSRSMLGQGVLGLLGAGDLDEESWEEIEDTLLMADIGAATSSEIIERLRTEMAARAVRGPEQARALLREVLVEALGPELPRSVRALPHGDPSDGGKPAVVLVVGVNGTGKTTTTGKLARVLVADGRSVLLGAADTFRAAAVEQLGTWGERVGAEVVRGNEGADPASVAFEAVQRGADTGVDAILVDTAGRLHTKTGLMDELGKVKRVVEKRAQVDEVLLVLDATTGQNGLAQARVFADVVDVTGIVLTKLDGTAKGGIVFQVQRELGVPVKLVGLGEGADDLAPFEPQAFVDALLE